MALLLHKCRVSHVLVTGCAQLKPRFCGVICWHSIVQISQTQSTRYRRGIVMNVIVYYNFFTNESWPQV